MRLHAGGEFRLVIEKKLQKSNEAKKSEPRTSVSGRPRTRVDAAGVEQAAEKDLRSLLRLSFISPEEAKIKLPFVKVRAICRACPLPQSLSLPLQFRY